MKLTAAMEESPLGQGSAAVATMVGKLTDGDEPELVIWTMTDSEGDCELFEPSVPHCDPDCGGLAACVEGDCCVDYPKAQTVGNVLVSGVGPTEFEMQPIANNYAPPNDVKLPYPPCAAGDKVSVAAQGGAFGAFALETKCIDVLDFPGPLAIEEDQPLALSWSAPTVTGISRIRVKMDISHHGGSRGKIECDVDDDGSFEIAASLVSKLVDLESRASRRSRSRASRKAGRLLRSRSTCTSRCRKRPNSCSTSRGSRRARATTIARTVKRVAVTRRAVEPRVEWTGTSR